MANSSQTTGAVAIRDAATVALLRDDATQGLQVLLLRRHSAHVFGASAEVFPGGAVDPEDIRLARSEPELQTRWPDAAWRIAAIRECFEEAGLLMAEADPSLTPTVFSDWRRALNTQRRTWRELVAALAVQPHLSRLVEFAYWVTPHGPPKRYAARFYAARAPANTRVVPDGHEIVSAEWVSPSRALAQAGEGQRWLMPPTRATLEQLSGYDEVAQALQALEASTND